MLDYSLFDRYEVTKEGKVYGISGKEMSIIHDSDGYCVVSVHDEYKKKYLIKVHRLVAYRYIPTNDYSLTVNHIDGDKNNNSVSNLEWMTSSDNLKHSWNVLGRKHFTKKVMNSKGETFDSLKSAALQYGTSVQNISNCCNGIHKTCKGLEWRFFDE